MVSKKYICVELNNNIRKRKEQRDNNINLKSAQNMLKNSVKTCADAGIEQAKYNKLLKTTSTINNNNNNVCIRDNISDCFIIDNNTTCITVVRRKNNCQHCRNDPNWYNMMNNNIVVNSKNICDRADEELRHKEDCSILVKLNCLRFILCLHTIFMCLYKKCLSILMKRSSSSTTTTTLNGNNVLLFSIILFLALSCNHVHGYANEFEKTEQFLDKINLEKSIAAVFNKVAYGSTTKRSIPDNAYPITTLATPLLTTYHYSNGNEEWLRVDVKNNNNNNNEQMNRESGRNVDFEQPPDFESSPESNRRDLDGYGADLEKDHALPTSAPAADILKNNNNKHYNNPNRYNNDRLRPDFPISANSEQVTENVYKTTTTYNILRNNVRPTKSVYSKDPPSYVPPSRSFFTPPLPPEYQNPFADKPTLRGTNSDSFAHRRPLPPPSLMPNKDRIPFRPPDLPNKVNNERPEQQRPSSPNNNQNASIVDKNENNKKKSLNTPSQNVRLGEFYGLNRSVNESNFEYEKSYVPAITRILSGSNGRQDEIPDILLKTVTATPNVQQKQQPETKVTKTRAPSAEPSLKMQEPEKEPSDISEEQTPKKDLIDNRPPDRSESVTVKKDVPQFDKKNIEDVTTQISDTLNLANTKEKDANVTKASSEEIWMICWKVHVYLVVFGYIILAIFSIYKLIRYENDPHMFSKSYFLTIHLMLTVICVLRIFYLTYDPYNIGKAFNIFLYEFLHSFPLSLLATTFAVLIVFLLKRTLTHLEVKTRPIILVVFALLHIVLCMCLSIFETLGHFNKASDIICRPSFVLLAWALGCSYLYLYRIIKNVLAKKSQNLSEMCTQNISYASHITIAVALLFILLGFVQFYALFFIRVDRFDGPIRHHWILWSFELSVRFIEISIITLLAIVVSLKLSQREKQTPGGFPLFPCTTSDSSTDNIYPNNCNTNPNALNYSRQEMIMDNIPNESVDRPNLLKNSFQNDSFDKKSTLERYQSDTERSNSNFDRFERPKWGSDRFDSRQNLEQTNLNNLIQQPSSGNFERARNNSARTKTYDSAKYYTKPKYGMEYNNDDYQHDLFANPERNIYSEPIDNNQQQQQQHQYERTRHEFERSDFDRRSRNSSNTSGRRSTGRTRKSSPPTFGRTNATESRTSSDARFDAGRRTGFRTFPANATRRSAAVISCC